jgi:alanine-glyoxylate transaminase/serine-glyoxylate transaminase/serine-pyruvate transaminase
MPELMIAGPGELYDEDLEALGQQVIAHYGDFWVELHAETLDALGKVMGASELPYLMPGTGTTCLDAGVANLFEPGQRVVVANTGFFGARLMEVAAAHRLDVVEVPVEVGEPIDVERLLDAAVGADGVLTVHVETATGIRHPIETIANACHQRDLVYFVDGIASVGGEHVRVDEMGIHAIATGSQKGLEAPPGFGILALSAQGKERVAARSERPLSWYLDLHKWDWYRKEWGAWHPSPVTMPSNLTVALYSSLRRILEAGMETWVERRAALAHRLRAGLADLGLEPVAPEGIQSNLVVAMWAEDPAFIQKHLASDTGIMISGGLAPTMGKAIRVGLMGRTATDEMVDRVLGGVAQALGKPSPVAEAGSG